MTSLIPNKLKIDGQWINIDLSTLEVKDNKLNVKAFPSTENDKIGQGTTADLAASTGDKEFYNVNGSENPDNNGAYRNTPKGYVKLADSGELPVNVKAGQENINLLNHGFLLDGSDEATKLRNLSLLYPQKGLIVPSGKLLGIGTAISLPHLSFIGNGTVQFSVDNALLVTETVNVLGVFLDANGFTRPIELRNDNGYLNIDDGAKIANVYSVDNNAQAVLVNGAKRATFGKVEIENIRSLTNSVLGDEAGSAAGIVFAGAVEYGSISSAASFSNIHTVDANGSPVYEDADGVRVQTKTDTDESPEYIEVSGKFTDCGRHGVRFNATGTDGIYKAVDVRIESPWDRTGSEAGDGDGMTAAVSSRGGKLIVENLSVTGGALNHAVTVGGDTASAIINGVQLDGQYAKQVNGVNTSSIRLYPNNTEMKASVNNVSGSMNFSYGIISRGYKKLNISECEIRYDVYGVQFREVQKVDVHNNEFYENNTFVNSASVVGVAGTEPDNISVCNNIEHNEARDFMRFTSPVLGTTRVRVENNDALSVEATTIIDTDTGNVPVHDGERVIISGNRV